MEDEVTPNEKTQSIINSEKNIEKILNNEFNKIDILKEKQKLDNDDKLKFKPSEISENIKKFTLSENFIRGKQNLIDLTVNFQLDENAQALTINAALLESNLDLKLTSLTSQLEVNENNIQLLSKKFSPQNVEYLLNQASDLLERGIKTRAEWDDLCIKTFDLYQELSEFLKLDDNLQAQIKDGLYKLELDKVNSEIATETTFRDGLIKQRDRFRVIMNTLLSPASGLQEYLKYVVRLNLATYHFAGFFSDIVNENPKPHDLALDDERESIAQHAQHSASFIENYNKQIERQYLDTQIDSLNKQIEASSQKIGYLEERKKWELKSVDFKLERDKIIREKMIEKYASFEAPEGVLNYVKRILPLKVRFQNDFTQAYSRLTAAQNGLKNIYGISEELPELGNNPNLPSDFFDKCISWLRKTINEINQFSQAEVFTKTPVSIRNLHIDQSLFLNAFQSGKWSFEVKDEFFKDKFHVRLRGISLSIIGLHKNYKTPVFLDGCIEGAIRIPQELKYKHLGGQSSTLDLSGFPKLPDFTIGRVYSTEKDSSIELTGGDSIVNTSPIGSWEVQLNPVSRPFFYEKRGTETVRLSISNFDGATPDDPIEKAKQTDIEKMEIDHRANLFSSFPKFRENDFYDLQIDLYIAYKLK